MRDLLSWNLSLGRWGGVHVRLHMFFVLWAVYAIHSATSVSRGTDSHSAALWYGLAGLGLLFVSVLAHEFGHCLVAWKVEGTADSMLLWPLGGLVPVGSSREPQDELVTAVAGPLTSLVICTILAPMLFLLEADVRSLANPLLWPELGDGSLGRDCLRLAAWLNWVLVLANCLPVYPLDGGRAVRALLTLRFGPSSAGLLASRIGKWTAVAMCLGACLAHSRYSEASLPLALIGILLFFIARQEGIRQDQEGEEGDLGYDFSQGYTSLEGNPATQQGKVGPGAVRQWLERRRASRLQRQQEIEQEEERRVDEVLARLHDKGPQALSDDDRALLDRVSARYRNRQQG